MTCCFAALFLRKRGERVRVTMNELNYNAVSRAAVEIFDLETQFRYFLPCVLYIANYLISFSLLLCSYHYRELCFYMQCAAQSDVYALKLSLVSSLNASSRANV